MNPPMLAAFGKVPARGDFIRSAGQPVVTQTLDRWASQALDRMAREADWKPVYDQAAAMHFAFLGVRSPVVLAGHLRPSQDASGRRFPLITATAFDIVEPLRVLACAPRMLAGLWSVLDRTGRELQRAADAAAVLARVDGEPLEVDRDPEHHETAHHDYLDRETLESLREALAPSATGPAIGPAGGRPPPGGAAFDLRRTVLALGLLLRAVPTSGARHLDKGIVLPLPALAMRRPGVATLWLDLVHGFLARGAFEVALFVPVADQAAAGTEMPAQAPSLAIGFAGGAPQHLQAMLDPGARPGQFIDLRDAGWVDAHVGDDYALQKLSRHLERPQSPLRQITRTFREAFLGE